MKIKPPGTERAKGDKSPMYTDIRRKLSKMERSEWQQWYRECLEELQKNKAVWEWLNHKGKWEGQYIKGVYQRKTKSTKRGRPFDRQSELDFPDTRNLDWNEI